MLKRIHTLFLSLAMIAIGLPAVAAGLNAQLSASQIAEGDQVVLQLSADTSAGAGQPDLSVLDADFNVLGTSSGTQTTIINGRRSDTRTWQITLMPKRAGTLTIPSISAGKVSSEPLELSVIDAANLPPEVRASRPAVSVSIGSDTIFAHQEIPLTVRTRLPAGTQGAQITAPDSADLLLEQVGEDRSTRQPDGTILLERQYFMRPQKDGALTLDPFVVTASVVDSSRQSPFGRSPFGRDPFEDFFRNSPFGQSPFGRDPFGSMFQQTRNVTAVSDPVVLQVDPTPGGATGWALPAKGVELREVWQPDPPEFRVGEAVTRKVQVLALGAHGEQIPDIDMPEVANARIYFDGVEARSVPTENGTAAVREFTWSIVPTSGGDLVLPELAVDWFDVTDQEPKRAVLAGQTYPIDGPVIPSANAPRQTEPAGTADAPLLNARSESYLTMALLAGIVVLVLAVLSWIVRLILRRRANRAAIVPPKPKQAADRTVERRRDAIARLSKAVRAKDASAAHRATMDWVRATDLSIEAVRVRFPDLGRALDDTEAALFGASDTPADLGALFSAVRAADKKLGDGRQKDDGKLPPLYPATA